MGLEIEIKYLDADHAELRRRLAALEASRLGAWFEANTVLDTHDRALREHATLLRLRTRAGRSILTLKRRPQGQHAQNLKVYEEFETEVSEPTSLRAILGTLGYRPAFAYEKIREKWRLGQCVLCLDTLPFGDFLEIEGPEDSISECARMLKLDPAKASTATYHRLNREHRQALDLAPDENFVFNPETRRRLIAELEGSPLDSEADRA